MIESCFARAVNTETQQNTLSRRCRRRLCNRLYGSDIKLQTRYILEQAKRTATAGRTSLDQVVKAQVFLTDLDDYAGFDEVWREYFPVPPPRTTVGTTGLLVRDALIEIDLIVARPAM